MIIYGWKHPVESCPGHLIGCTKIGQTKKPGIPQLAAANRIAEYTKTAGVLPEIIYAGSHKTTDDLVRQKLVERGFEIVEADGTGDEWVNTQDLNEIKNAIVAAETGKWYGPERAGNRCPPWVHQEKIIKETDFKKSLKWLWNVKTRGFKTTTFYHKVKQDPLFGKQQLKVAVLSFITVAKEAFVDDAHKWEDFDGYHCYDYKTKTAIKDFQNDDFSKVKIIFSSFQVIDDISSSIKDIEKLLFNEDFDYIVVDEDQLGAHRENNRDLIEKISNKKTKFIFMSGTPYQALAKAEFSNVVDYTYIDEQKLKAQGIPDYQIMPKIETYCIELKDEFSAQFSEKDWSESYFFKTNKNELNETEDKSYKNVKFKNEDEIKVFLSLLHQQTSQIAKKKTAIEFGVYSKFNIRHSLWKMNSVAACFAMEDLLKNHPAFSNFKIIRLSGKGGIETKRELNNLIEDANKEGKRTVTLTCNRLVASVSIKLWDSIFILHTMSSPCAYFQLIARCQTPDGTSKKIGRVFNFSYNNAVEMSISKAILEKQRPANKDKSPVEMITDITNYEPIFMFDGSQWKVKSTEQIMTDWNNIVSEEQSVNALVNAVPEELDIDPKILAMLKNLKSDDLKSILTLEEKLKKLKNKRAKSDDPNKESDEEKAIKTDLKKLQKALINTIITSLPNAYIFNNGILTFDTYLDFLDIRKSPSFFWPEVDNWDINEWFVIVKSCLADAMFAMQFTIYINKMNIIGKSDSFTNHPHATPKSLANKMIAKLEIL